MKLAYEPRASTILYNLLTSRADKHPFLLPANICPIVPITFLKAEIAFEFVDISPITLHMDLEAAYERLKTDRFGGILYAHTYGETSTPDGFFRQVKALNPAVLLMDDRCLCLPDVQPETEMIADVTLYSTGSAKVVELGFGGYAFLQDEVPYQRNFLPFDAEALEIIEKNYKTVIAAGQEYHYGDSNWLQTDREMPAWDEYVASIGESREQTIIHRQAINAVYASRLPAQIQLPMPYSLWRFHILVPERKQIVDALFKAGLFATSHYVSLAGIFAPGHCPRAEELAAQVVNLFNNHHYTVAMAEKTCEIILSLL